MKKNAQSKSSKIILILGGGFIGSYLFYYLSKVGNRVFLVTRRDLSSHILVQKTLNSNRLSKIIREDVLSFDLTRFTRENSDNIDVIINCAGLSPVLAEDNPHVDFQLTFGLAAKMITQSIGCKSRPLFLGISSRLELDHSGNNRVCHSVYARHRLLLVEFARSFSKIYPNGIRIIRLPSVFGYWGIEKPGGVLNTFLDRLLHGKHISILGDSKVKKDFIYIEDVACAVESVIMKSCAVKNVDNSSLKKNEYKNEKDVVFNVGGGKSYSLEEIVTILHSFFPKFIVQYKPLPENLKKFNTGDYLLDNIVSTREIGWTPKFSTQSGIKHTLSFYSYLFKKYKKINI